MLDFYEFSLFGEVLLESVAVTHTHTSAVSSVSQAIQMIRHDWVSSQVVWITFTETDVVSDELILIFDVLDLDHLVPDSVIN